jgi:hypothetical protein
MLQKDIADRNGGTIHRKAQSLNVESQNRKSRKVAKSQSLKVSKSYSRKVSESQNLKGSAPPLGIAPPAGTSPPRVILSEGLRGRDR